MLLWIHHRAPDRRGDPGRAGAARACAGGGDAAAHAARVYRDQLDELERDKAEGRISAVEAEAARAEIARRLIAADSEARARARRAR